MANGISPDPFADRNEAERIWKSIFLYYIRKFNKKWQAIKFLLLSGILFRSYIIFIGL